MTEDDPELSGYFQPDRVVGGEEAFESQFRKALEFTRDLGKVNEELRAAGREDLVIEEPVKMKAAPWPYDTLFMNSFVSFFRTTDDLMLDPKVADQLKGASGLGEVTLERLGPQTGASHIPKPAFARIYNLFPDLTEEAIGVIAGAETDRSRAVTVNIYDLMASLVDGRDDRVVNSSGEIDGEYLTR